MQHGEPMCETHLKLSAIFGVNPGFLLLPPSEQGTVTKNSFGFVKLINTWIPISLAFNTYKGKLPPIFYSTNRTVHPWLAVSSLLTLHCSHYWLASAGRQASAVWPWLVWTALCCYSSHSSSNTWQEGSPLLAVQTLHLPLTQPWQRVTENSTSTHTGCVPDTNTCKQWYNLGHTHTHTAIDKRWESIKTGCYI